MVLFDFPIWPLIWYEQSPQESIYSLSMHFYKMLSKSKQFPGMTSSSAFLMYFISLWIGLREKTDTHWFASERCVFPFISVHLFLFIIHHLFFTSFHLVRMFKIEIYQLKQNGQIEMHSSFCLNISFHIQRAFNPFISTTQAQ